MSHPNKVVMTRLRNIFYLIFGWLITIVLEILLNSLIQSSLKTTLFQHILSSLTLTTFISIIFLGLIFFVLLTGLLVMVDDHGIFVIYILVLKFFELFPLLIDLINFLFIYQNQMKDIQNFNHFNLSLIVVLIRLIINLNVIRWKCDRRWKRQILNIFDLLLFILVNISLIRYSNKNLIRIGRKLFLGLLNFQLNDLFYNTTFWISLTKWNEHMRHHLKSKIPFQFFFNRLKIEMGFSCLKIVHSILTIRWIISLLTIYLFIVYTFQSTIINVDESLFYIHILLKSHGLVLVMCISIFHVIHWDTLQNQNTLDQYGVSHFCTGIIPTKTVYDLPIKTTTIVERIPMKKKQQTCLVCYDDKDLSEFDCLFVNDCKHLNRSVCNFCLFHHVQQAFQITFTDDIYCPELKCGVKLNYDTVKTILFLNGDDKLVERYDRYVFYRQLEQMEEFIWCSNSLCNVGQLHADGRLNNIVTCFNCHQKTCFTHRVKWHEGINCEEYDMKIDPDDESSRRWIVENSKKCPKCPYQIEKNDGCDHITCIKCHHEFCWSCLADFQPIRQHGNHRHNSTCKHYAQYNEE